MRGLYCCCTLRGRTISTETTMYAIYSIICDLVMSVMINGVQSITDDACGAAQGQQTQGTLDFFQSVAFTAKRSSGPSILKTGDIVTFDDVKTNVGNNYKPEVGALIAPHNGVYSFTLGISSSDIVGLGIMVNDTEIMRVDNDLNIVTVATELIEGSTVYVQVKIAPETPTVWQSFLTGHSVIYPSKRREENFAPLVENHIPIK
ncbi:uncharacterized protein LOC123532865 [Mercenaria mercenaria]|uniref:uncharacterized protein LOC123532865 n=1 Tax=Mercenaria mercenaria TaxID=6596 RepID=UPI00234E37BC|nr:uncharacterized protein LOC123532865 [Mercenaria mercenaria]